MADFAIVCDPDDVALRELSLGGGRCSGAYTVDALYHAWFGMFTDSEVWVRMRLVHSADCATVTSFE